MSAPAVIVVSGPALPAPRAIPLAPGQRVVLGRGVQATFPLPDEEASRLHVALTLTPRGVEATDLGSGNGTWLGAERLAPNAPRLLPPGATLRVGTHAVTVQLAGAPAAAAPPASAPRLRDEYEREGELGRGAYGAVYAARHRASGRRVAIKALHAQGVSPTARERFLREARVRLDCPQVAQVYELREEGENLYLVMELVPGRAVEHLLAGGPLPLAQALWIAAEVARALAAAHAAKIVHRDIKPSNILVTAEGAVKVVDFGIAKELGQHLTATGQGIGTLDYLAPEQAADAKRVDPSADLYALGATLYHLIAGQPPFDSKRPDFFERLFEDPPRPLVKLRPDCPKEVSSLVLRLLAKDPEDRPVNAATVARQLDALRAKLDPRPG